MTETELKDMAAAAKIGESKGPPKAYNKPGHYRPKYWSRHLACSPLDHLRQRKRRMSYLLLQKSCDQPWRTPYKSIKTNI
jgi:hypothetical protein